MELGRRARVLLALLSSANTHPALRWPAPSRTPASYPSPFRSSGRPLLSPISSGCTSVLNMARDLPFVASARRWRLCSANRVRLPLRTFYQLGWHVVPARPGCLHPDKSHASIYPLDDARKTAIPKPLTQINKPARNPRNSRVQCRLPNRGGGRRRRALLPRT
jgi:hypothetical protein